MKEMRALFLECSIIALGMLMRWLKRDGWKVDVAVAGMLLLLVLMVWVPVSAARVHSRVTSGFAVQVTVTVQATPTEDATVTALNKEKLTQEVSQQQHTFGNWLWSNAAAILSSFLSTLVVVIGALIGYRQWRVGRKDIHAKELEDRRAEREKQVEEQRRSLEDRAEERFQAAVVGLGDDKEGARIGAAILLRTFLREGQGYEQFYVQTFDLAVANLRLPRSLTLPEDPDGLPHLPEHPNDTPWPLTTLSQALIVVFKEAFPLAREWLTKQHPAFTSQTLDATGIQLDNAYLSGTDLNLAWIRLASMRAANLRRATLSGANLSDANLSGADLREANLDGANLRRANLSGADLYMVDLREPTLIGTNLIGTNLSGADLSDADLSGANLYRVRGLTREQLEASKAQGAIIDEGPTTNSSQPTVAPPQSSQSNDAQALSAPPAQVSRSTLDIGGSSATISPQQGSES